LVVANVIKLLTSEPEALILVLFLVVPGFIFTRVLDTLVPGRRQGFGSEVIDIGAWSFTVLAVWFFPGLVLLGLRDSLPLWLYHLLLLALIVLGIFVTPILAAYILYRLEGRGYLKSLGAHPNPTSWDWFFSNRAGNYYVRFHRKEGRIWADILVRTRSPRLLLIKSRFTSKKSGDWTRMGSLSNGSRVPRALW
jgi:Family of unknown function (DUF6338)